MDLLTKHVSEYQPLVVSVAKELGIKHPDEENTWKNDSKRRKMSITTTSEHKGHKQFKCDICNAIYGRRGNLNKHVATVHEGSKQFNCDICNAKFGQKGDLNRLVKTVHERKKKQFKCDICNTNFGQKSNLNRHIATIHDRKKTI